MASSEPYFEGIRLFGLIRVLVLKPTTLIVPLVYVFESFPIVPFADSIFPISQALANGRVREIGFKIIISILHHGLFTEEVWFELDAMLVKGNRMSERLNASVLLRKGDMFRNNADGINSVPD